MNTVETGDKVALAAVVSGRSRRFFEKVVDRSTKKSGRPVRKKGRISRWHREKKAEFSKYGFLADCRDIL